MSYRAYTQHSPHPFTSGRANGVRAAVLAALLAVVGTVDLMAIAVTDTTGWTAWNTFGSTTPMTDGTPTPTDSGISSNAADFTGVVSQQAGLIGSTQSVMWQVETNETGGGKKFDGVIGLGVGLTDNPNEVNFVMLLSATNATQRLRFASMTGAGGVADSPSELTWGTVGNSAGSAGSSNTLTASTYNKTSAGVITFALSYATLQQAIQSYAGAAFSSFVVDDLTHLNFVAFTDSSATSGGVAINGDLFGAASTATTRSSTATFTSLGMGTTLIRPGGGPIPEPAAIYQLGGFVGVGLLGFFWRRRRGAKQADSAPSCT
jgi:hypothetical protein